MIKVFKVANQPLGVGIPRSALWDCLPPDLVTEYPIGVPVKPKVGKVFAFETLEHARNFTKRHGCFRIFEAQTGKTHPLTTKVPAVGRYKYLHQFVDFWKGVFEYGDANCPDGTVLCDWIILGKEVQ